VTVCMTNSWGSEALNGAHNYGTCVQVEEPSTASISDT